MATRVAVNATSQEVSIRVRRIERVSFRGWAFFEPDGRVYGATLDGDEALCTCRDWCRRFRRTYQCEHIEMARSIECQSMTETGIDGATSAAISSFIGR